MSTVYISIIGSLLAGFGMIFTVLGYLFGMGFSEEWRIYRSWVVMVGLTLVAFWFGRNAIIPGIALVSLLGYREFARAVSVRSRSLNIIVIAATAGLAAIAWLDTQTIDIGTVLPLFLLLITVVPVIQNRSVGQLHQVGMAIAGFVYFGYLPSFLYQLVDKPEWLLYLLLAVQVNDVAACNFGKLFGKRALRPQISPRKTYAGAMGAVLLTVVMASVLLLTVPLWQRLLLGLIISVGGQLGDLIVSYMKRDLGLKDMGALIPGHGGMLDRTDSLIYAAPLFVLALHQLGILL